MGFMFTFFLVFVKTESILISPLIVFKSILTYGSLWMKAFNSVISNIIGLISN